MATKHREMTVDETKDYYDWLEQEAQELPPPPPLLTRSISAGVADQLWYVFCTRYSTCRSPTLLCQYTR